jgi:hypothetical protein
MTVRALFWRRFNILQSIVADVVGRIIATLFYFIIILPFGVIMRLVSDPLHIKSANMKPAWLERHPVSSDLDSARQQG